MNRVIGARCQAMSYPHFAVWMLTIVLAGSAASLLSAATLTTIASFDGANGSGPVGGLFADAAGNLYGTCEGSQFDLGRVYRLSAGTYELTTLALFNGNNGAFPVGGLIADAEGNFYGTASEDGGGSGAVFRLEAGTNTLTALATFYGANGARPWSDLIADAAGNLYGTTNSGGADDLGTVFRLDAGTNEITTVVSFNGANGGHPASGLIADAAGNLYGTTQGFGPGDRGTVFRLEAGTNELTTLASFSGTNGASPYGGLIADAAGNYYGTTEFGGASDRGTVFRLEAGTNTITTLASFDGANGRGPFGGVIADAAGNLYGTTETGGASNRGTVFRLEAGTNTITTLATFGGSNGNFPVAGLIADAAGNLYGTTITGGPGGYGTVFRLQNTGFVVVPEPNSLALASAACLPIVLHRRRRKKKGH